jgi:protein involved in polysaccharide export with SLBB domain
VVTNGLGTPIDENGRRMTFRKTWATRASWACLLRRLALVCLALAVYLPTEVAAQIQPAVDAGRPQVSRTELEQLLKQLEETAESSSSSEEFKKQARLQADAVSRRLREGDFQVGDQIQLTIQGEEDIPVLTVAPGRVLVIPNLGELSLAGVLRSELLAKLHSHISRFIRDPVLRTQSLIRLAVTGAIGKPGFHLIAVETPLPEAIMSAGGPAAGAKLENLRIERGGVRIWEGARLQRAIAEGQTLDQMSLRSGDEIMLPGATESGAGRLMRILTIASGVAVGIIAVLRGF